MRQTRSNSAERAARTTSRTFPALAAVAAAFLLAGCSYSSATRARPTSDAMLRVEDSVRTHASVELGYATEPRAQITGAVSTTSFSDGTRHAQVRSLFDLLQGRVAGLEVSAAPGGSVSMRVRGAGGGFAAADPLVVVDGDPMPGGGALQSLLSGINAQDVIRVDVLKDISATAIYGTRGSNGVVLITLRHRIRE